jgi:hypothetical protein
MYISTHFITAPYAVFGLLVAMFFYLQRRDRNGDEAAVVARHEHGKNADRQQPVLADAHILQHRRWRIFNLTLQATIQLRAEK